MSPESQVLVATIVCVGGIWLLMTLMFLIASWANAPMFKDEDVKHWEKWSRGYLITFQNGEQYTSVLGIVWYHWPSGKRCSLDMEEALEEYHRRIEWGQLDAKCKTNVEKAN